MADLGEVPTEAVPRGQLRIYLGGAPGVGKTFAMLAEARRRAERGASLAIGAVDTRGRERTVSALQELQRLCGSTAAESHEIDLEGLLAIRPQVVLVDDLEHLDHRGSHVEQRYQAVDVLLDSGIDVVATLDIQHLASVAHEVERMTGQRVDTTIPDAWVREADQIELVDMSPEALRRRLAHGNVVRPDEMDLEQSLRFTEQNLAETRLLALTWVADWVAGRLARESTDSASSVRPHAGERVMVAVTAAPGNDQVIRRAARIAERGRGSLFGVHVQQTGSEHGAEPGLARHRALVEGLGGVMLECVGDDIAAALVEMARKQRATQVVVGASRRTGWQRASRGSVLGRLLVLAGDLDVHVISSENATDLADRRRVALPRSTPIPRLRRLAAWGMVVVGLPAMALLLVWARADLGVSTSLLLALGFVVLVSSVGGLAPGLVAAAVGAITANYFVVPPTGTLKVSSASNVLALAVFVAVGSTVAFLVDRVAARSLESTRARAEAAWLARAAATQAVDSDPLPGLLEMFRTNFGLDSVAVLRSTADGRELLAAAGTSPPQAPEEGDARHLGDGSTVAVFRGGSLEDHEPFVVDAFLDQLAVAVNRRDLQAEASASAALEEANELRTGILQAVSHDLRTPLAGIKASVTSLLAPDLEFDREDTEMFLHTIDDEVDRLDRVVGNLLDMSRLQSRSMPVALRPTPLEDVVSSALANIGESPGAVEVDVPATLPLVEADPALLERALANVVANALAVQPPVAAVRIQAGTGAGTSSGKVLLRVIDAGPGIPVADREKVREPFQRLGDRSTQAGVGLGLAIATGFCRATGASLDLDDTPGGGLTAVFTLPIHSPADQGEDGGVDPAVGAPGTGGRQ